MLYDFHKISFFSICIHLRRHSPYGASLPLEGWLSQEQVHPPHDQPVNISKHDNFIIIILIIAGWWVIWAKNCSSSHTLFWCNYMMHLCSACSNIWTKKLQRRLFFYLRFYGVLVHLCDASLFIYVVHVPVFARVIWANNCQLQYQVSHYHYPTSPHMHKLFHPVWFQVFFFGLLTLIGSSVMDATHLILISPYLHFSMVEKSSLFTVIT